MNTIYAKTRATYVNFNSASIFILSLVALLFTGTMSASTGEFNSHITFSNSNTCDVVMPDITSSNGCAELASYPFSTGGPVEFMWAENNNGNIQAVTGWSTSQVLTYCPTEPGIFRICARTVGCSQIFEGDDVTVGPCGEITGLYIYSQSSDQAVYGPIANGDEISLSSLPNNFYLTTETTGAIESVNYDVDGNQNVENVVLYTHPGGAENGNNWNNASGAHTVTVSAYNGNDASGELCDELSVSFTITNGGCDNVTSSGEIEGPSSICTGGDITIESISLPSGGSGGTEYVWLFNADEASWQGASEIAVNAPELTITPTESGWYRRCARSIGCSSYDGESNWVYVSVEDCLIPPTEPTCSANSFLWTNNIDIDNLSGSAGIPQVDVRFVDGNLTCYTIPGPYPAEFNGAVTVSIDEAVSWDAYTNRPNTGNQPNEQWSVVFFKNGSVVYSSQYTGDLPTGDQSAEWVGSLDQDIFLPNGADEIKLVHYEDDNYGAGSSSSANSVVPVSICLSFEQACALTVDLGNDIQTCEGEDVIINSITSGGSSCTTDCERAVSAPDRCSTNGAFVVWLVNTNDNRFSSTNAQFIEHADGTASFTATASNGDDVVDVDITYSNRTTSTPSGSPKNNECETTNTDGWVYYTQTSGTIVSQNHGTFNVERMGPSFQLGYSAMHIAPGFGASGWLTITGGDGYYQQGDINIELGDCVASGSTNALSYLWSNGETTSSISVDASGTYSVVVTDCNGCTATDEIEVLIENCCDLEVSVGDDVEICGSENVVLSSEITGASVCEDTCTTINEDFNIALDIWNYRTNGTICEDYFTSTIDGSNYSDLVDFNDPIGNSDKEISSITIDFNVAACNGTSAQNNASYPIELNGHLIGYFNPTELPCNYNQCDPNGTVSYTIDASALPYNYGGQNTLDLNFASFGQHVCVANVQMTIHTEEEDCVEVSNEISYLWSTGETTPEITVSTSGTYTLTVTDCFGCEATDEVDVTITPADPIIPVGLDEEFTVECNTDYPTVTFENGTVVDYTEYEAQKICSIELSTDPSYNWRNFWFHSFPAAYNKNFVWNEGQVVILADSTAEIFGKVENVDLPGSGFSIHYYFEELVDYDAWVASGGYLAGDADAPNRVYARVDFTKPNSIIGFGEFANSDLELVSTGNVAFMDFGPRSVYGGNGVGFWIDYTGTVNGMPAGEALNPSGSNHNDMYAAVGNCKEAPADDCAEFVIREWTVEDACEVQCSFTQTVTINDTTDPEVVSIPDPVTIGCNDPLPNMVATFTDNCDDQLNITMSMDEEILDCGNKTITLTQVATDDCGNSISAEMTINVVDNEAPSVEAPADASVDCDNGSTDPSATGTATGSDACGDVTITFEDGPMTGSCPASFIRTWTAADDCGNTATDEQTISIIDETAPTITANPHASVECGEDYDLTGYNASDACSDVTVTIDSLFDASCGNTGRWMITYTATDACGNSAIATQNITIVDTTAPEITAAADETVECGDDFDLSGYQASDICGDVTVSVDSVYAAACGNTGDLTLTYTATDECGNTSTDEQIITIVDTTNPEVVSIPDPVTIGCNDPLPSLSASFSDICDDLLDITMSMDEEILDCGNKIITLTQIATDDCGNSISADMTINVVDNEAPSVEAPADAEVDCDNGSTDPSATGTATGSDACSDVTITSVDGPMSGECPASFVRTWIATDACGNTATDTQTISIIDNTPPTITANADASVECGEDFDFSGYSASDACSDVTVSIDSVFNPACGNSGRWVITYTATDACGNSASDSQNITIEDTTSPEVILSGETSAQIECSDFECGLDNLAAFQAGTLQGPALNDFRLCILNLFVENGLVPTGVEDNCDSDIQYEETNFTIESIDCGPDGIKASIECFFSATDDCGNTAETVSTVIELIDTTAPTITANADATVECDEDYDLAGYAASDLCGEVSVSSDSSFIADCGNTGVLTITYTATDECGNTATDSQTITIVDTTAPEFQMPAEPVVELSCDEFDICAVAGLSGIEAGYALRNGQLSEEDSLSYVTCVQGLFGLYDIIPTAEDNCDNDSLVEATSFFPYVYEECTSNAFGSDNVIVSFVCYFNAEDACGNAADSVFTVINLVDNTAPIITADADAEVECGEDYDLVGYNVSDDCSYVTVAIDSVYSPACENTGRWVITYTATDACGNSSTDVQNITIVDTTPPTITANADATVQCDEDFDLSGYTADDICSSVTVSVDSVFTASCGNSGTWILTYTATDGCENSATDVQVITVEDTTDPVVVSITEPVTIGCNDPLPNMTAVFNDNCDEQLDVDMDMSEELLDCGNKIITFTQVATDDCGNSVAAEMTVYVSDNEAPEVEAPADVNVDCDNGSTDPSATGTATGSDDCSAVTITFVDGPLSGNCPASFIRTWTATDACGNSASDTQTISIIDETAPSITAHADASVECGDDFDLGGYNASDACGEVTVAIDSVFSPSCGNTGRWVITYTATDACGNSASDVQNITIVDTTVPVIVANPDATVECSEDYDLSGYQASDICGDVIVTIDSAFAADCGNTGVLTLTYLATDACGNTSSDSQVITIEDTTAPILIADADATVECGTDFDLSGYEASDLCGDVSVTIDSVFAAACGNTGDWTLTYTATDECGNTSQDEQIITIVDTTSPSLTANADATVECGDVFDLSGYQASDLCGGASVTVDSSFVAACGNTGIWTLTYTATDDCGNTNQDEQLITIVDTTPPSITCPGYMDIDCAELDMNPDYTGQPVVSDVCGSVDVTYTDIEFSGSCPVVYERTWIATDDCGNTATCTQILNVVDITPPALSVNPDATVECGEDFDLSGYEAYDTCGETAVTIDSAFVADCGNTGVWTLTYTATDECENTATATQIITIVDTTSPEFITPPADETVDCESVPAPVTVSASDICGNASVELISDEASAGCPYTVTRTWIATDACGNTASHTQVITVIDQTAPVLSGVPQDIYGDCGAIPVPADVTASDNCTDVVPVIFSEDDLSEGCITHIIRTWTATDACGNSTSASQTIRFEDTTAPEIFCPADVNVDCSQSNTDPSNTGYAGATDNCDDEVSITYVDGAMSSECPAYFVRTWTAEDLCGNTATCEQTISIVDETAPIITAAADVTLECGSALPAESYEASDDCSSITVEVINSESPLCGDTYELTRTYIARDACGNSSSDVQVITFIDTTAPELTINGDAEVECGDDFDHVGYVAEDSCGDVAVTVDSTFIASCGNTGRWEILYTATDDCGNTATATQNISIIDTTSPEFEEAPENETVECDAIPAAAQINASDICGSASVSFDGEVMSQGCPFTITRTWTATDACDNTSQHVQVITVIDTQAPSLTVETPITIECGDQVPASNYTVSDNCDDDVTVNVSEDQVDGCGNTYTLTRTYTATDLCGNSSVEEQVIIVQDHTAPVIDCPADITLDCAQLDTSVDNTGEATASDICDDQVDVSYVDGQIQGECPSSFVRTWTAMDDCGNTSTCDQVITIVDETDPVLTIPEDAVVSCEEITAPFNTGQAVATDDCSGLTVSFEDSEIVGECPATFTRTWTATDGCGNTAIGDQLITIVDETAPELISGPSDTTVECGDALPTGEAQFQDNCDDELSLDFNEEQTTATCGYEIVRTWTATDNCGNSSVHVQTITIEDTTAPELNGEPANVTVQCDAIPAPAQLTASDICDTDIDALYMGETSEGSCPMILTRTWMATDACGNSTAYSQVITVVDETSPVFTQVPADIEVPCGEVPAPGMPVVTDNCDDDLTIDFAEVTSQGECPVVITRTWSTEDACGNSSSVSQIITVIDEDAPEFDPYPVTVEIQCDEVDGYMITASDNCSNVTVTFTEVPFSGNCYGTLERTWTATDDCGNSVSTLQYIFIKDDTAPIAENAPENMTIECGDEIPEVPTIVATDNCDTDVEVLYSETQSGTDCPFVINRAWTLVDDCGNETLVTQVITVVTNINSGEATLSAVPNPFTDNVKMTFSIPEDGFVVFEIHDALGATLEILYNGYAIGGIEYEINVNAQDWKDGVYYSRLIMDESTKTERILRSK